MEGKFWDEEVKGVAEMVPPASQFVVDADLVDVPPSLLPFSSFLIAYVYSLHLFTVRCVK